MSQHSVNQELFAHLKTNISRVIVGKEKIIDLLMVAILSNGHVLLEDMPGMGKTMLAKTLAKSIGGTFKRIQFTPDVLPSDVTGINLYNPKEQMFELRVGPVQANVLLADEINRATPRTQSALLEAMEERQVTIDGQTIQLPDPFLTIATQNPVETQGTFPLPEAQMDRFLLKLSLGYPTLEEEQKMIQRFKTEQPLDTLQPVIELSDIKRIQEEIKRVYISPDVELYLLSIVRATREHEQIEAGVSPRGTLALMRAAQAKAYLDGRDFVRPDDIKSLAPSVLAHRFILTLDAQLHFTEKQLLEQILEQVKAPLEEVEER